MADKKASTRTTSTRRTGAARRVAAKQTAKSPVDQTQSLVDKVADGWKVDHAQPPQTTQAAGPGSSVITVTPGMYRAWKRNPNGTNLIEAIGDTPEQLRDRIDDWERSQFPAEPAQPTEEQIMNSAAATLHLSLTSGARQAVDVDVTPAAPKREAKARRLRARPHVEEVKLSKQDQGLAGQQPPSTGVGTGT